MALRGVPEHPKFAQLKALLGSGKGETLGYLEALWHFTGKFTMQGNVGKFSDAQIESWIEYPGEPGRLIWALTESKWLDRSIKHRLLVHDWIDHADQTTKKTLGSRKQKIFESDPSDIPEETPQLGLFRPMEIHNWNLSRGNRNHSGASGHSSGILPERLLVGSASLPSESDFLPEEKPSDTEKNPASGKSSEGVGSLSEGVGNPSGPPEPVPVPVPVPVPERANSGRLPESSEHLAENSKAPLSQKPNGSIPTRKPGDAWKLDETFIPFQAIWRKIYPNVTDEDWVVAHREWRLLDPDQRETTITNISGRHELGQRVTPLPFLFTKGEWKRGPDPIRTPVTNGFKNPNVAMIEELRAEAEKGMLESRLKAEEEKRNAK